MGEFKIPWISVHDDFPPEDEKVLVTLVDQWGNKRVDTGFLDSAFGIWVDAYLNEFSIEQETVTHWFWLPDPEGG